MHGPDARKEHDGLLAVAVLLVDRHLRQQVGDAKALGQLGRQVVGVQARRETVDVHLSEVAQGPRDLGLDHHADCHRWIDPQPPPHPTPPHAFRDWPQRLMGLGRCGGTSPNWRTFAVQHARLHERLDGVSDRVAKVQDLAQAALALVLGHHVRLDAHRRHHDVLQQRGVAGQERVRMRLQPVEQGRIPDRCGLS